jgi:hypothetical protein
LCVITAGPSTKMFTWGGGTVCVCVFYYCRTYYKAVRVGGGGEWRTCAMRDDEPRPVWMSLPSTHWDPFITVPMCVCLLLQDLVQRCFTYYRSPFGVEI